MKATVLITLTIPDDMSMNELVKQATRSFTTDVTLDEMRIEINVKEDNDPR